MSAFEREFLDAVREAFAEVMKAVPYPSHIEVSGVYAHMKQLLQDRPELQGVKPHGVITMLQTALHDLSRMGEIEYTVQHCISGSVLTQNSAG